MNICHIIIGLNVGGAELMLRRLVESSNARGQFKHSVISLTNIGTVGQALQEVGVNVYALGMRSGIQAPVIMYKIFRWIRAHRPDVVQTWMYHADLLGGVTARLAGVKNVIWGVRTTELDVVSSRSTVWVRWLCSKLSSLVPHTIIFAAEASCRSHISLGYDSERVLVIPNGFELRKPDEVVDQHRSLRSQWGIDDSQVVVGCIGRFHDDKDQRNFVVAAGKVAVFEPSVRFVMLGRQLDEQNTELCCWIEATGFKDHFVLLGERSDVPSCLAAMNIFCLSSRTEGFPNVVGEAMAMGLPCVVTDVGDAAMLVADCGVVVPKEDSDALANGLTRMLAMSKHARFQMGQKAKARVHAEFSMDRARERFEAIYQRVGNEADL